MRDLARNFQNTPIFKRVLKAAHTSIPIFKPINKSRLDCVEDLFAMEHSADDIYAASDITERNRMIAENIMLFAKEYGNISRFGATIDNAYIGQFIEALIGKFAL